MGFETLKYEVAGNIAIVTLFRPQKLNAFTLEMGREIVRALDTAEDDDGVRAVIVTGDGPAFCAGMDLSVEGNVFGLDEAVDPLGPNAADIRDSGGLVTLRIFRMTKPVIGALNGVAVGIGATMTLPMDARIVSSNARVGFVFSRLGICTEACSSWFLPRLVGMSRALDWVLSGDILSSEELLDAGFAQKVTAPEDLLTEAMATARRFTSDTSPLSIAANRQLLWQASGASHPMEAHQLDSRLMLELSLSDGKEGVAAFQEKRKPKFPQPINGRLPRSLGRLKEPAFR
ncbi:enoyl-CoA hydratase-related protein [Defluviimonas sp. SAOS-178_SWC]|uniref:enoyl-CoA hydratase-related protein n=1 Tax=Defluviimonas sp. SAOS-178_SWC TaxID=3121287 RepID=UPI003221BB59